MWLSLTVHTDAEHADALSDALMEQGAISVGVEDAQAGTPEETPQFGEPGMVGMEGPPLWQRSRVIALFDPSTLDESLATASKASSEQQRIALQLRVAAACQAVGLVDLPNIDIESVAEQNWVQLTQAQFDPICINERLWIVPTWHAAPDPAAINLILDPGMAFGTGSHPTTRLCLEWLCDVVHEGARILDYGCGSGILAIAAAKLGAATTLGVDIDEHALVAARDNAMMNQVELALQHSRAPLEESFDIVVANILTNPLCVLAGLIAARVAPQGQLALSGVLESQADEVIAAYAPFIALRVAASLDGWVRLEGERTL